MGTEESKKIVLGFFENLNAGNASRRAGCAQ